MKLLYLLFLLISLYPFKADYLKNASRRKPFVYQESFWPLIKGKWWLANDKTDIIIRMQRIPIAHGYINFFSEDSCEIEKLRFDDMYIKERYKWIHTSDMIVMCNIKDTVTVKVLKLTSSNFYFRPQ